MTAAQATSRSDEVAAPWPDPSASVLRGRVLQPGAPVGRLSRFGDDVWDLQPAHPDAHQGVSAVHWTKFPAPLALSMKAVCLAWLEHPVPAERALRSRTSELMAVQTISQLTSFLQVFADWLTTRGTSSLNQVTDRHLDAYRTHVLALACPRPRKRRLLNSVLLLHAYRDLLPPQCRLATRTPWGGALPEQLVEPASAGRDNATPRIASATMEALLGWSLRMLRDFGPDITAARHAHHQIHRGRHQSQQRYTGMGTPARLLDFLATARVLPGARRRGDRIVLSESLLCRLIGLDSARRMLSPAQRRMVDQSGLPIVEGYPLDTSITGIIDGRPWRHDPITTAELPDLVRFLTAACFVTTCYLSGMRPGEALNLRRGCRDTDPDTGELLVHGRRGKGRGRTPHPGENATDDLARPWVAVQPVHEAIAMLEQLTEHRYLFPSTRHSRPIVRPARTHARTTHYMTEDIADFINWVNHTFVTASGAPIPADPAGRITLSRFRRTLARFIVRRPRGLIAAALQYAHVATRVTLSYAGRADTGWMDDLAIERLEHLAEQAEQDQALLDAGEHVSGPSAHEYRARTARAARFAGRVVTSVRNAERLLARTDAGIHHGDGMTCVWSRATAACRTANLADGLPDDDRPDDTRCRTTCTNLAYTDRDVNQLKDRLPMLEARNTDPLVPKPLRDRAYNQLVQLHTIIDRHGHNHPDRTQESP